MIHINDVFSKIYCVNLDKRTDRWNECQELFKKYDMTVERFRAIDMVNNKFKYGDIKSHQHAKLRLNQRELGCIASHLTILIEAAKNKLDNVLILEDDVAFIDNFNVVFDKFMQQVPKNWNMLYLGGNQLPKFRRNFKNVSENVQIRPKIITTSSYAIDKKSINLALNILKSTNYVFAYPIDVYYSTKVQPQVNTYMFKPRICWQRSGFSDIRRGQRHYFGMRDVKNKEE